MDRDFTDHPEGGPQPLPRSVRGCWHPVLCDEYQHERTAYTQIPKESNMTKLLFKRPIRVVMALLAPLFSISMILQIIISPTAGAAPSSGSAIRIDMVAGTLSTPFFGALKTGAAAAASQLGVKLTYIPATITGPTMAKALTTAIASKPTALSFGNWFPSSEDPYIKKAGQAGIPVDNVNAAPLNWTKTQYVQAYIGQSDYTAGLAAGKRFAAAHKNDVLCIDQDPGAINLEQRCDGLTKALKAIKGKVTVVEIPEPDDTNTVAVISAIGGALAKNKGVDGILTLGTPQAPDAVRATKANPKIKIATFDLSTTVLQDIKSGQLWFAINQQPYMEGYYAVSSLVNDVRYDLHLVGHIPTGPVFVTKTTVNGLIKSNTTNPGILGAS